MSAWGPEEAGSGACMALTLGPALQSSVSVWGLLPLPKPQSLTGTSQLRLNPSGPRPGRSHLCRTPAPHCWCSPTANLPMSPALEPPRPFSAPRCAEQPPKCPLQDVEASLCLRPRPCCPLRSASLGQAGPVDVWLSQGHPECPSEPSTTPHVSVAHSAPCWDERGHTEEAQPPAQRQPRQLRLRSARTCTLFQGNSGYCFSNSGMNSS